MLNYRNLFVTDTTGTDGDDFGADTPVPGALVQPSIVAVTVYVAASFTVMDEPVSPLLHCNEPVALVDNTELPQLFVTDTTGADGDDFGADVPLPASLVHPSTVCRYCISSRIGYSDRWSGLTIAPSNEPVAEVDNTELPQLFTTVTTGAVGVSFGADVPASFTRASVNRSRYCISSRIGYSDPLMKWFLHLLRQQNRLHW